VISASLLGIFSTQLFYLSLAIILPSLADADFDGFSIDPNTHIRLPSLNVNFPIYLNFTERKLEKGKIDK
jgi:hypothetical protein